MRVTTASLAILAMLAAPGVATAQGPGNGGADEYSETIPGAGGNHPTSPGGGGGGGEPGEPTGGGGPLTPAQIAALEAAGEDGAAAAALAQSTGRDTKQTAGKGSGATADEDGASSGASSGDSAGSGITELVGDVAAGSDDGMGPVLPIILAAALIGAIAFLIVRRGGGQAGRT
jgi:hypothetical protein